jgi:citrate lyase subunit beta/citryl-CoA lyase
VLTPGADELRRAREIGAAFEAARARGGGRVIVDGSLVEVPTYSNAKRLIARDEALQQFDRKN